MTDIDPEQYLAALDEARTERDALHPHRPVLELIDGGRTTRRPPTNHHQPSVLATTDRYLDKQTIALGRRRIEEMRALINRNRSTRRPE